MVHRYAHLVPNHLTEHAKVSSGIFGDDVPKYGFLRHRKIGSAQKRNALIYKWRACEFEPATPRPEGRCSIQLS